MNAQLTNHDDDGADLMAAEYVLGVLDAQALRIARGRLRSEPAFARDVAAWEAHFLPWIESLDAVPAPATAWPRIRRSLGWGDPAARTTTPVRDTPPGLGFWRGLAFGGVAVAAVCAIALLFALRHSPVQAPTQPVVRTELVQPDMVASIAADDGRAMLVASIDRRSGAMLLTPAADMAVPSGRDAQLWLIPAGGKPQSLGVIDPSRARSMTIPAALRAGITGDALLAVSIEPRGGSPTGQPTGPVVAKGAMRGV